ncbi:MAG: hypothetical protein EAX86_13075 [Candidatus Heimdallarchaeota archaeon]|nr:hypothetical protein [Candidatus Heimdallarchaeota archaeon]
MDQKRVNISKKFVNSTILAWVRLILVRGSSIIYLIIIARLLTQAELGRVTSIAIGTSFLSGIITPWIAYVLHQKALSLPTEEEPWHISYQFLSYGIIITFIFNPILSFLYLGSIGEALFSETGILFLLICITLSFFQLLLGHNRAFLKIEYNIIIIAAQSISNFFFAIFFYLLSHSIIAIYWGWLISDLLIIGVLLMRSGLSLNPKHYLPDFPTREIIQFSLPVFFLYLFRSSRGFIDDYFVLLFFGEEQLALYHYLKRIVAIASEAVLALLVSFMPLMTKILTIRPERKLFAFEGIIKILMHFLIFGIPLLIFCPEPLIEIILGDQYLSPNSMLIMVFLGIGLFFTTMNTLIIRFKGARGDVYTMLGFSTIDIVFEVGFLVVLVFLGFQSYESVGVAFSITLAVICSFLVMAYRTEEIRKISQKTVIKLILIGLIQIVWIGSLSFLMGKIDLVEFSVITLIAAVSTVFLSSMFGLITDEEFKIITRGTSHKINPYINLYKRFKIFN